MTAIDEQRVSDTRLCKNGIMSANDPAGSPGGVQRAEKLRELLRLAEKNYRHLEESRDRWPDTVVALEQADESVVTEALMSARVIDAIFALSERGPLSQLEVSDGVIRGENPFPPSGA